MSYRPLPFIAGERSGRHQHLPLYVDEAFLLEHYASASPGQDVNYHPIPEPDPATDLKLLSRCIASFISGDPGPQADEDYRLELAEGLLADFRPGDQVHASDLLQSSDDFHDFTSANWPRATIYRHLPLRASTHSRRYDSAIDWLAEQPDGNCILMQYVHLSPKQYRAQSGLKMAELRLQAELLSQHYGKAVTTAFLHLPATGTLTEVAL
jgi:hypothetical protein